MSIIFDGMSLKNILSDLGYILLSELELMPLVERRMLKVRGEIIEISTRYNEKYSKWNCTAKVPNSSIIAYCRDKNKLRAETVSMSRLLITYEDYKIV